MFRALTGGIFTPNRPASVRSAIFRATSPITKHRPQFATGCPQCADVHPHFPGDAPQCKSSRPHFLDGRPQIPDYFPQFFCGFPHCTEGFPQFSSRRLHLQWSVSQPFSSWASSRRIITSRLRHPRRPQRRRGNNNEKPNTIHLPLCWRFYRHCIDVDNLD
jgi:hypothetical protein